MRVRASRSLKGSIAEGELIDVALDTRRNSDGTFTRPTNEYLPKPGSEILVMLSTTASQVRGAAGAYGLAKFSKIAQPYDIVGNQAVPIASDSGALAL